EAVVLRSMQVRPQDRFESVHALGRALMPLASPKRRVIWADYYEHDRSQGGSGEAEAYYPSSRSSDHKGGTRVIDVADAPVSSTRMSAVAPAPDFEQA